MMTIGFGRGLTLRKACAAMVTGLFLAGGGSQAADVRWTGAVNGDWSNTGNWLNGTRPASASDNVYLVNSGAWPTNQDIAGLRIGMLCISNFNGLVIGGQDLILKFVKDRDVSFIRTNWISCNLRLSENTAWQIWDGRARVIVTGSIGEYGGTRNLSGNYGGTIELRGRNTHTDGFKNNQSTVAFYSTNSLGVVPSTVDTDFFTGGYGGWQVLTTGGFSRVEIPETCGTWTTGGQRWGVSRDVKLVMRAPVSGSRMEKPYNDEGTLVLAGTNGLTGNVNVNSGVIMLANERGLGPGSPTAVLSLIGTIDLNGYDLTGQSITCVNGYGYLSSGEIKNSDTSRTATINGNVNLGGSSGGYALQFGGNGDIVVNGVVSATPSPYMLRKIGDGILTLTATNTHASATGIEGGGLTLDYTIANSSKLSDSHALYLAQSKLRLVGTAAAPTTETIGSLGIGNQVNVAHGASSISLEPALDQNLTLAATTLTVNGGSTVDFSSAPNGSGVCTFSTTSSDGLFAGSAATWNRATWAKIAGGAVTGMTDDEFVTAFGAGSATTDVDVPAGSSAVASASAARSLRFRQAQGATVTIANGITLKLPGHYSGDANLRAGILMTAESGPVEIASTGSGQIDMGLNQALYIHQYSTNSLTLSARIGAAGSGNTLVKAGPGELVITGNNNTMGGTTGNGIYGGTVAITSLKDAGTTCSLGSYERINLANATLKYIGTGNRHNRRIYLRGSAALDASGSGPWVFTHTAPVVRWTHTDHYLTLKGSGSGVLLGKIDLLLGGLRKEGTGDWTICGPQTYVGDTTVTGGTLALSNACSLARSVRVTDATLAGSASIGEDLVLDGTYRVALRGDQDYDKLQVRYDATLQTTLAVELADGYVPAPGQSFTVLTAGDRLSGDVTVSDPRFEVTASDGRVTLSYAVTGGTLFIVM